MLHLMFDIDGTLLKSNAFDEACFVASIRDVLAHHIDTDWNAYPHVSDSGILREHLARNHLLEDFDDIQQRVKARFIQRIQTHLVNEPALEVRGAAAFIAKLKTIDSVSLSIATGGWKETAELKLASAGIDITGIPIASANDHHSRTEIMRCALAKAQAEEASQVTYFGDAAWDQRACKVLAYQFILIGNGIRHYPALDDFVDIPLALSLIGI